MAKYSTNTEELTSIADAIRAKTGSNSSLVYPTGFVTAIQNISTGSTETSDGFGINPELIQVVANNSILLKNTDYSTWTPSSTAAIIVPQSNLLSIQLDMEAYDYSCITDIITIFAYKNGTTVLNGPTECYFRGIVQCARRASRVVDLENNNYNQNTNLSLNQAMTLYKNSSGVESIYYGNAAIYCSTAVPSFSSSSATNPTITFRSPVIRAVTSDNYLTANMANAIDQDNTILTLTSKLYRYRKGSTYASNMLKISVDMYNEEHTN